MNKPTVEIETVEIEKKIYLVVSYMNDWEVDTSTFIEVYRAASEVNTKTNSGFREVLNELKDL